MKTLSFLDNLVARNLPETAVIQPRPISLFEPWPGTVAPFPVPAMGEEETAVAPTPTYPPPAPPATPLRPRPSSAPDTAVSLLPVVPSGIQPESIRPLSPASAPTSQPIHTEHQPQKQLSVVPSIRMEAMPVPPNRQAEPPSVKQTNAPVIIKEQIKEIQPLRETMIKTSPTLVEVVRKQTVQPSPSAATAAAITPEQPVKPVVSPVPLRAEQIKPVSPATNRPDSYQPPIAALSESVPTVHITIGRIEIRATPSAPAKAEKKQAQTPVLSLEDYLRQRNGGRP